MDDDDSQDELINTNTSHGRGKRAAMWVVSGSLCDWSLYHELMDELLQ